LDYQHSDITYQIIGCAFQVFRTLGPGYDEATYHKAYVIELKKNGFDIKSKLIVPVDYRKNHLLDFEIDIIVNDIFVLELKEVQSTFMPIHYNQLISYLKNKKKRLGYLFNFGLQKVFHDRIIYDEKPRKYAENYDEIVLISNHTKQNLKLVRKSILTVLNELGLGMIFGFIARR